MIRVCLSSHSRPYLGKIERHVTSFWSRFVYHSRPYLGKIERHVILVSIRVSSAAIPRQNQTSKNFTKLLRTLRSYGQTVIPSRPYLGKIKILRTSQKFLEH